MQQFLFGILSVFFSVTVFAQSQDGVNQSSRLQLASGAVYWAHCDQKCDDMRCQDKKACSKACIEGKGTIAMCPKVDEKPK